MAPTEEKILKQYLIAPSQLSSIISLEKFKELFPPSLRSSVQVRSLYRDLHAQRNAQLEAVTAAIDAEVKRSKALRRAVANARREAEQEDADLEVELEKALHGFRRKTAESGNASGSLLSVILELETAAEDLEAEIRQIEIEEAATMQQTRQTVDGLSDLRYGRFSNSKLRDQIVEGLDNLRETCQR